MHEVQKKIVELLDSTKEGFTINQISDQIGVDRHTAGKYLEALQAMGICEYESKGKSKIWSLTPSPVLSLLKSDNPLSDELRDIFEKVEENVTFQDAEYKVLWSNKKEQENKYCYEVYAGKTKKCKDCGVETALDYGKEVTSKCGNTELTTKPLKNKNNKVVAVLNVRKEAKNE